MLWLYYRFETWRKRQSTLEKMIFPEAIYSFFGLPVETGRKFQGSFCQPAARYFKAKKEKKSTILHFICIDKTALKPSASSSSSELLRKHRYNSNIQPTIITATFLINIKVSAVTNLFYLIPSGFWHNGIRNKIFRWEEKKVLTKPFRNRLYLWTCGSIMNC